MGKGFGESPVYVGEISGYREIVHYIGPDYDLINDLIEGLETVLQQTRGAAAVLRAAAASFGFVFIHPLADGNGRVSRFLINDVLRRDGAIPAPNILPVSATISSNTLALAAYDAALEAYSRPLMERISSQYRFGKTVRCKDGV